VVVFQVKAHKDVSHFETAYVVKIHNAARLAPSQSVRFLLCSLFVYLFDFMICLVIVNNLTSFLSVGFVFA
jgi:hypothetical protein